MSFVKALQSLLFYVASCAPCHAAVSERQRKKEAKQHRERIERMVDEPGVYKQPAPLATNPYWQEEIRMGPRYMKTKHRTRGSTSSSTVGRPTTSTTTASTVDTILTTPNTTPQSIHRINTTKSRSEEIDSIHKSLDNPAGSRLYSKSWDEDTDYFKQVHPPVNDYHPPIIRRPPFKSSVHWMVQPPPPARIMNKIMKGTDAISRSASMANPGHHRSPYLSTDSLNPITLPLLSHSA